MSNSLELLEKLGLLPVLRAADSRSASAAAAALHRAKLAIIDLPYRAEPFAELAEAVCAEATLAVSGVRNADDCAHAVSCGAELLIADALCPDAAAWCAEHGVAYVPTCVTSCEIEQVLSFGCSTVHYTPCDSPLPCAALYALWKDRGLRFIVSGAIDERNHAEFADKPYIRAVRGDFLCPDSLLRAENYAALEAHARQIYQEMLGFELGHIGIGTSGREEGHRLADALGEVFGVPAEYGNSGNWVLMRGIEVVNGKTCGVRGHFAVQCNNVVRAVYYMESNGHPVRHDSFRYRYPGRLSFAYLDESFGDFDIHLMLRWTAP